MSLTKERLKELLKYYKEFREEVWLLQRKYENMRELREAELKLIGKIELLNELIDEEKRNSKGD